MQRDEVPGDARSEDLAETDATGRDATAAPYLGKDVLGDPDPWAHGSRGAADEDAAGVRPRADLAARTPYNSPRPLVPVRLDTNESPYPPPGALRADLAKLAGTHDWHRYGDLDATALRERLSSLHERTVAGVWVAAGAFELLVQLLAAFGGAGRTMRTFAPAWGGYRQVAAAAGTNVLDDDQPGVPADVLVVCSPNNPTGETTPVGAIAQLCADHPASLVLVDEAYAEFSAQPSAAGLLDQFPNLAVLRTFSKALALADLRLGYLLAHPEIVAVLPKVRVPWQPPGFAQAAGLLALDYLDDVAATIAVVVSERERLVTAMTALAGVRVLPSEANFLCFATPRPSSEVRRGLLQCGVAVRDVSSLARLPKHLRVTIGTPADNQAFLTALGEVLP